LSEIKAFLFTIQNRPYASHKDDFGFVKEAFETKNIEIIETESLPEIERSFVVVSGSDLFGKERQVSKELSKINKVVLFITSDEAGAFDVRKISHPDIKIWRQYPSAQDKDLFKMPLGAPATMRRDLPEYSEKDQDLFFAGQVTHQRRAELVKAIESMGLENYLPTPGFMQGHPRGVYYEKMSKAKIVPAPAGHPCIDSFRFYEAIEMLAMPIGDLKDSRGRRFDIWTYIFSEDMPFPTTNNWHKLPAIMKNILSEYPQNVHQLVSWWIKYKRDFANKIMEQINED
jgi:hypothetical protein